jgi:hypothetical protein
VEQRERREKEHNMQDEEEEMPEHEALLDTTSQIRVRTLDIGCDIIRQLRIRTVKRTVTLHLHSLGLHVHI